MPKVSADEERIHGGEGVTKTASKEQARRHCKSAPPTAPAYPLPFPPPRARGSRCKRPEREYVVSVAKAGVRMRRTAVTTSKRTSGDAVQHTQRNADAKARDEERTPHEVRPTRAEQGRQKRDWEVGWGCNREEG